MAEIGKATLAIIPKLSGLDAAVKNAFANVDAESIGMQAGSRYGSGIAKGGAIAGAFAAVTQAALGQVTSSVDAAISRFDTLNNYPKVMESLGYASDSADASIGLMSDRLQGLPTALNSMASTVQGITAITHDIDKSTKLGLALNDMLLAGGQGGQVASAAMEQFRQILAKGKPELQDWRSLISAAPGQMDQLARAMLGPTANANDLYRALGGGMKPGDGDPLLSMEQLMDAIIKLDSEGGAGIKSFEEQARSATDGVATQMENIGTAMSRGIAGTLDAVGKDNITSFFSTVKSDIDSMFGTLNGVVGDAMPTIKGLASTVRELAPALLAAGAANLVFGTASSKVGSMVEAASGRIDAYKAKMVAANKTAGTFGKGVAALGGPLGIASLAITVAAGLIGYFADKAAKAKERQEQLAKATTGLSEAVAKTAALDEYRGKVDGIGEAAKSSAMSVDELIEANAKIVDKMNETNKEAQEQIGTLNAAQSIIHDSAGKTDLSADAQGRLQWALKQVNEQFGLSITAADVAAGKYADQDGNVQDLVASLDQLIEKKKQEIQMDALADNYSESLKARSNAAKTYADAVRKADAAQAELDAFEWNDSMPWESEVARYNQLEKARDDANESLRESSEEYRAADDACKKLEVELADTGKATSEAADAYDKWGNTVDERFKALVDSSGGIAAVKEDMRALGVSTETLASLTPAQLEVLGKAYDGTALSIAKAFQDMGISLGEGAQAAYDSALKISDALAGIDAEGPLSEASINVSDFALALANSGATADTLANITAEDFAAMAEACGGSIQAMIAAIQLYNAEPIIDKDGTVRVEETTLVDALGNVYKWNGQQIINKDGTVVADTKQLMDAKGQVVEWNGQELKPLDSSVKVDYSSVWDAYNALSTLMGLDGTSVTATVSANMEGAGHATGGFRLHAAGGIRRHAAGAIARRAVPLDIVGEDGTEAIVPLTNKRYAQPFIDLLAEGLDDQDEDDDEAASLARAAAALSDAVRAIGRLGGGSTYNITFNGTPPESPERYADRLVRRMRQAERAEGR